MTRSFFRPALVAAGLLLLVSGSVHAQSYRYDATAAEIGYSNSGAGQLTGVTSSYNAATQRLAWAASFVPNAHGATPDGFWLALNDGPNPKGTAGELPIFYFDASKATGPILTAYGYNGENGNTSYYDGSPAAGTQAPDRIFSSLLSGNGIYDLTYTRNANGTVTMGFDIDASRVNGYRPINAGANPWDGADFGSEIGVWFHPTARTQTSYTNGYLSNFTFSSQGWLDNANSKANPCSSTVNNTGGVKGGSDACGGAPGNAIPEPTTAALGLLALPALGFLRRKR
jgi:hypothetical protein